ncbi:hypothetical protein Aau02nite_65250 [Amorphoplanes auranticolor]|uniref:Uncharacterized protein n=1 Tax=Actinoplanes auranticolor TaxID=47988 RepID=A0A919VTJ0_9ACTN|nr:hypothetical protein Aau02nite_65250 [Actinoplanes auranticolor]
MTSIDKFLVVQPRLGRQEPSEPLCRRPHRRALVELRAPDVAWRAEKDRRSMSNAIAGRGRAASGPRGSAARRSLVAKAAAEGNFEITLTWGADQAHQPE